MFCLIMIWICIWISSLFCEICCQICFWTSCFFSLILIWTFATS